MLRKNYKQPSDKKIANAFSLNSWLKAFKIQRNGNFVSVELEIPSVTSDNYEVLVDDDILMIEVCLKDVNGNKLSFSGDFNLPGIQQAKLISQKLVDDVLNLIISDEANQLNETQIPVIGTNSLPEQWWQTTTAQLN